MLNSKQRAQLRGLANKITPVVQVGKQGLTPEITAATDEALEARELIKISFLDNSPADVKESAEALSGRTRSEVVSILGSKLVLYRKSKTKQIVELVK